MNFMYMELKALADKYPDSVLLVWVLNQEDFDMVLDVVEDPDDEDSVEQFIADGIIAFYIPGQEGFYTGDPIQRVDDLIFSEFLHCFVYDEGDEQMYVFYKENHDN